MTAPETTEPQTTLLLVRHGQTEWNADGRVQGHTNSDLTQLGRKQAEAVARLLLGRDSGPALSAWSEMPTAIYTSDLQRTQETAQPLATQLSVHPTPNPALREMNFGELEGLTWPEVETKYPELASNIWGSDASPETRPPGGESRVEMHTRSSDAITEIAQRHPGETVAVVSHGGVISSFLRAVLGIPFGPKPGFYTANGSIAVFRYTRQRFKLVAWGIVPTLDSL